MAEKKEDSWKQKTAKRLGLGAVGLSAAATLATLGHQNRDTLKGWETTEKRPPAPAVAKKDIPTKPTTTEAKSDYSEAFAQAKEELKGYLKNNIADHIESYYLHNAQSFSKKFLDSYTLEDMIKNTKYWRDYSLKFSGGREATKEESAKILDEVLHSPEIIKQMSDLLQKMKDNPLRYGYDKPNDSQYDNQGHSMRISVYELENPQTQRLSLKHTIPVDKETGKPTDKGTIENVAKQERKPSNSFEDRIKPLTLNDFLR